MKKVFLISMMFIVLSFSQVYAYNPNSFTDEETLTVQGKRPKVDIEVSEVTVQVEPENFVDGIAEKVIKIDNAGNVPCHLTLTIDDVPVDLKVNATVDNDFLLKGESTNLNIVVELTDMQETESFEFTILVEATLRP